MSLQGHLTEARLVITEYLTSKNIPLQMRNRKLIEVKAGQAWGRLSHLSYSSTNVCLGASEIRDRGSIVVSLFFPLGSGATLADTVSYELRDLLSQKFFGALETGIGEVIEVPTTEDFFHLNVYIPFRHN